VARYRSFAEHLAPEVGPKRILALDGGGLRGVLTLGMLREIETLLRARHGDDPDFRLCDYFDLIAGTSTGAIIAAALSLGMSVDEVHGHYMRLGQLVFKRSLLRWGALRAKFDGDKVREALLGVYGERRLDSKDFRTGLLVVTKRLDTGTAHGRSPTTPARSTSSVARRPRPFRTASTRCGRWCAPAPRRRTSSTPRRSASAAPRRA